MNRYDYKSHGLFVPYALANFFTLITVLVSLYSYKRDGVMANKNFQDIVSAVEDPKVVRLARSRKRSITAVIVDNKIVLHAGIVDY